MAISALDSKLYGSLLTTSRITELFSDASHVRHLLKVEAALARAQAKLGVIPVAAAQSIVAAAQTLPLDLEALRLGIEHDGFPVIELVRQLREHVGLAAAFVHFGATTQDIMDSALVLQIRQVLELLETDLKALIKSLSSLASRHRNTIMVGRTHSQQALPITFGLKVTGWIAPLLRHHTRLQELKPRVLVVQFGGAVGTLASLDDLGLSVQAGLAQELGLHLPVMPWHTQRDSILELAGWLSMHSSSLGKMAQDILLMAQSEIAELRETGDTTRGGSSTMPQKSNPITSELILMAARLNASLLSSLHNAAVQEHERGTHGWQVEWLALPQMMAFTAGALEKSLHLSQSLVVNETRMLEHVKASNGLMLAEPLSLALAKHMPPNEAKELVKTWVAKALEQKQNLIQLARAHTEIPVDWAKLSENQYLGSSQTLIERVLEKAKEII